MKRVEISSERLLRGLLVLSRTEPVCILDSCGVQNLGSRFLIAGISPKRILTLNNPDPEITLEEFDTLLTCRETASIFTISYDFGLKLAGIRDAVENSNEPDVFVGVFENLLIHDYHDGVTFVEGADSGVSEIVVKVRESEKLYDPYEAAAVSSAATSNFSKKEYISRIETIKSQIRSGNTYQTNLTQQFSVSIDPGLTPQTVFQRLRRDHPGAFAAFLSRGGDFVLSISPERFVMAGGETSAERMITSSPIKGTRRRGSERADDEVLRGELLASEKDRAENIMIVDLIRNDLGRLCEFGTVRVEKLCDLEAHPTLFHLVSTVSGILRTGITPSEIIRAMFPCGSISGCPKIRTMEIISRLETVPRGISMGTIGYCGFDNRLDMNVAIRTMVIKDKTAIFNTGGGIVIDSDPESEYRESVLKARALLNALGSSF